MSTLRAITVAFVALAVATLPVAGVSMSAVASEAPAVSVHADCCPDGQPCGMQAMADHTQDQGQGHCADHCGGKCLCLGLTAVLSASTGALSVPMPLVKNPRVAENASSPAHVPPAPPPRV